MSEAYENEPTYSADKELVDSIKMECSSISPAEQQAISQFAKYSKNLILEEFGNHISLEKKDNLEKVTDHFVIMDIDHFEKFKEAWLPEINFGKQSLENGGYYFRMGDVIAVRDNMDIIKQVSEAAYKQNYFPPGMTRDVYEKRLMLTMTADIIIHELIHYSQNMPDEKGKENVLKMMCFIECGASYATEKILRDTLPKVRLQEPEFNQVRVKKFEKLLEVYGDGVLDVCFGNYEKGTSEEKEVEKLRDEIYKEFDLYEMARLGLI